MHCVNLRLRSSKDDLKEAVVVLGCFWDNGSKSRIQFCRHVQKAVLHFGKAAAQLASARTEAAGLLRQ